MTRVEIPAYTDRWMKGDRYGEILHVTERVVNGEPTHIAHVKLDKSGKTVRVVLDDCTVVP
jgi:hypothetical protein